MARYVLRLFVTGESGSSRQAVMNARRICREDLNDEADLQIVDVLASPAEAEKFHVLATPTLLRQQPLPVRRIIGDLSDRHRVRMGLGLEVSDE